MLVEGIYKCVRSRGINCWHHKRDIWVKLLFNSDFYDLVYSFHHLSQSMTTILSVLQIHGNIPRTFFGYIEKGIVSPPLCLNHS